MTKSSVLVAFVAAGAMASVVPGTAGAESAVAPPHPEATVSAVTLSGASPRIVKTSTAAPTKGYTVEFSVSSSAAISTGKFQLGGMDSDTGAYAIGALPKDKCGRYLLNVQILKSNGPNWEKVLVTSAHGDWAEASKPGEVARCALKDASGAPPKTSSGALNKPARESDTYRVVVSAGFSPKSWPASENQQITEFRQVVATIALAN